MKSIRIFAALWVVLLIQLDVFAVQIKNMYDSDIGFSGYNLSPDGNLVIGTVSTPIFEGESCGTPFYWDPFSGRQELAKPIESTYTRPFAVTYPSPFKSPGQTQRVSFAT